MPFPPSQLRTVRSIDAVECVVSGLIACTYHPDKPSLDIPDYELRALPPAAFNSCLDLK